MWGSTREGLSAISGILAFGAFCPRPRAASTPCARVDPYKAGDKAGHAL